MNVRPITGHGKRPIASSMKLAASMKLRRQGLLREKKVSLRERNRIGWKQGGVSAEKRTGKYTRELMSIRQEPQGRQGKPTAASFSL